MEGRMEQSMILILGLGLPIIMSTPIGYGHLNAQTTPWGTIAQGQCPLAEGVLEARAVLFVTSLTWSGENADIT
jgi:hypothetical protein